MRYLCLCMLVVMLTGFLMAADTEPGIESAD